MNTEINVKKVVSAVISKLKANLKIGNSLVCNAKHKCSMAIDTKL